ncbi:unnamed protein product [Linum tenue]|uniref:DUF4283 domain-containing protein n=1 Tax=Linum tenue TaxID=586396 RepID=A0AAV0H7T4_9ROSI|nr:unnamed protein product [Linum tenue]
MKNGCFLVQFRSKKDYELASEGGPWLLGETYLTVHRWYKGFNPWKATVKSTTVWVQLPDLPIEFFNAEAVTMIAQLIGKPVRVDRATELGARGNYARVSVEVDLTKPLLSQYKVEGVTYIIQYEGLEKICGECGMFGQTASKCQCSKMGVESEEQIVNDNSASPIASQTAGRAYGDWMSVKKKGSWSTKKVESPLKANETKRGENHMNRFEALGEDAENGNDGLEQEAIPTGMVTQSDQGERMKEKGSGPRKGSPDKPNRKSVEGKESFTTGLSSRVSMHDQVPPTKGGRQTSSQGQGKGTKMGTKGVNDLHADHAKDVGKNRLSPGDTRAVNDRSSMMEANEGQATNNGAGNLSTLGH